MRGKNMLDKTFWRAIWFVPSFYGFLFWNCALVTYLLRYIHWDEPVQFAVTVFLTVSVAQCLSILFHAPAYQRWYALRPKAADPLSGFANTHIVLFTLHAVGFLGLYLYWQQLINTFGSWQAVLLLLASESSQIRQVTEDVATIGIQLTYLGWLAIGLSAVFIARRGWSLPWATVSVCQLLGNLTFVDRTRPLWILICAALIAMALDRGQMSRRPWRLLIAMAVAGVGLFVGIGAWVGKVGGEAGGYGATSLEGFSFSIYLYATGGFAYANELLSHALNPEWVPHRILYPVFKALNTFGFSLAPPSQIAEFLYVPYPTNVGTFLEPFINDGGLVFGFIGIVVYTFGFDYMGLTCLRSNRFLPAFFWAQLCFASMIGFFTPKIGSTPFWLFLLLAIASLAIGWLHQSLRGIGQQLATQGR
jgi:hypothetical protein